MARSAARNGLRWPAALILPAMIGPATGDLSAQQGPPSSYGLRPRMRSIFSSPAAESPPPAARPVGPPSPSAPTLAPDPQPFRGLSPRPANVPIVAPAASPTSAPPATSAGPGSPGPAAAPLTLPPPPPSTPPGPPLDPRRLPEASWESYGSSVEGRALPCATVGRGPRTVVLVGPLDGSGVAGVDFALRMIRFLKDFPDKAGDRRWVILPDPNPDGRLKRTRANARGVDLARNFPTENWRKLVVRHESPAGKSAGSEPETRALVDLLDRLQPELVLLIEQEPGADRTSLSADNSAWGERFARLTGIEPAPHRREDVSGSPEAWLAAKQLSRYAVLGMALGADAETCWNRWAPGLLQDAANSPSPAPPPGEPTLAPPLPNGPSADNVSNVRSLPEAEFPPGPPALVPLKRGAPTETTVAPPAADGSAGRTTVSVPGFGPLSVPKIPIGRAVTAPSPLGDAQPASQKEVAPGSNHRTPPPPPSQAAPWPKGFFVPQPPISLPAPQR